MMLDGDNDRANWIISTVRKNTVGEKTEILIFSQFSAQPVSDHIDRMSIRVIASRGSLKALTPSYPGPRPVKASGTGPRPYRR